MEQKSLLSYTPMHKCIMWPRYFFNKELQVVTRTRHLHKPATVKRRSVVTLFISLIKISEKAIFFITLSQVGPMKLQGNVHLQVYLFIRNSYLSQVPRRVLGQCVTRLGLNDGAKLWISFLLKSVKKAKQGGAMTFKSLFHLLFTEIFLAIKFFCPNFLTFLPI